MDCKSLTLWWIFLSLYKGMVDSICLPLMKKYVTKASLSLFNVATRSWMQCHFLVGLPSSLHSHSQYNMIYNTYRKTHSTGHLQEEGALDTVSFPSRAAIFPSFTLLGVQVRCTIHLYVFISIRFPFACFFLI